MEARSKGKFARTLFFHGSIHVSGCFIVWCALCVRNTKSPFLLPMVRQELTDGKFDVLVERRKIPAFPSPFWPSAGRPYGVMYMLSSWGTPPPPRGGPKLAQRVRVSSEGGGSGITLSGDGDPGALGLCSDEAYLFLLLRRNALHHIHLLYFVFSSFRIRLWTRDVPTADWPTPWRHQMKYFKNLHTFAKNIGTVLF